MYHSTLGWRVIKKKKSPVEFRQGREVSGIPRS